MKPAMFGLLALSALFVACTGEAPVTAESTKDLKAGCHPACVFGILDPFLRECSKACTLRMNELSEDPARCQDICLAARANRLELAERQCRVRCELDADGDGVPTPLDRCPETMTGGTVDTRGCLDSDADGVPDTEDQCPDTHKDEEVTAYGCTLEVEDDRPSCGTPEDCDRLLERPVVDFVSVETRQEIARRFLASRYHDLACPGKQAPPESPVLLQPEVFVDDRGAPFWHLTRLCCTSEGELAPGEGQDVLVQWLPVDDPCPPVVYSVFVESYFCHAVNDQIEPQTYLQNGSCRWMPYHYETVSDTKLNVTIYPEEILYRALLPFSMDLNGFDIDCVNCTAGKYDCCVNVESKTIWVRIRVIAHDGNGAPNAFAQEGDVRYLVFGSSVPAGAVPP